jgi:hypothetical protein
MAAQITLRSIRKRVTIAVSLQIQDLSAEEIREIQIEELGDEFASEFKKISRTSYEAYLKDVKESED